MDLFLPNIVHVTITTTITTQSNQPPRST